MEKLVRILYADDNNYVTREKTIPSFMLLDIKMPKLNGIDVLKEIRKSEEYKNLPVVVLTSSQIEADVYESYKLGVNAVVVKPIGYIEFVKAIKRISSFWGIFNVGPCN